MRCQKIILFTLFIGFAACDKIENGSVYNSNTGVSQPVGNLPPNNLESLTRQIVSIKTSIWLEGDFWVSDEMKVLGSGVIVKSGDTQSIITNRHVVDEVEIASNLVEGDIDCDEECIEQINRCLQEEECRKTIKECYRDPVCYRASIIDSLCNFTPGCTDYVQSAYKDCDEKCQRQINECLSFKYPDWVCYYNVKSKFLPDLKKRLTTKFVDGATEKSEVLWFPKCRDIDLAKIGTKNKNKLQEANLEEDFKLGDDVYAIGHPFLLSFSISKGIISGIRNWKQMLLEWAKWWGLEYLFEIYEPECEIEVIQTDAAINPGSSGGGLFKAETGGLVGINFAGLAPGISQGIGFAISIRTLKESEKLEPKANTFSVDPRFIVLLFTHIKANKL